jgi:hypothetical protein
MLLMLIEQLNKVGCTVISANTDGITVLFKTKLKSLVEDIMRNWSNLTKLELEQVEYVKYARMAVNDYVAAKRGYEANQSKIKCKGLFTLEHELGRVPNAKIVAKALVNYFIYDIPIDTTIQQSRNIFDFCLSEKTGKQ